MSGSARLSQHAQQLQSTKLDEDISLDKVALSQVDFTAYDHANGIPTFDAIAQVVTTSEASRPVYQSDDKMYFHQQNPHGYEQGSNANTFHDARDELTHALKNNQETEANEPGAKFLPSLYLPPQAHESTSYVDRSFPRVRRLSQEEEEATRRQTVGDIEGRFQPVFHISALGRSYASCVKPVLSLAFVLAFLELGSAFFLFTRGSRATTFIGACTIAFAVASGALALAGNLGLSLYLNVSRIPRSLYRASSFVKSTMYSLGSQMSGSQSQVYQPQKAKDPKKLRFEKRHAEQSIQSSSLLTFFLSAGAHLVAVKSTFAIAVLVLSESHPGYLVRDWFGNDPASSSYLSNQNAFSGTTPTPYSKRNSMNHQTGGWFSLSFARSDLNYVAAQAAAEGLNQPSDDVNPSDALSALEATASAATLLAGSISLASCVALAACLLLIRLRVHFPIDSLQVFLSNALFLGLSGLSLVATTARLRATPAELAALGHSLESDVSFSYSLGLFTLVVACLAVRRASGWYYIESRRTDVNIEGQNKALSQVILDQSQPKSERMEELSRPSSLISVDTDGISKERPNPTMDEDIAAAALTYDAIMREFDEMGQELGAKSKSSRVSAVADALSQKESGSGSHFRNWSSSIDSDRLGSLLDSCGRCCKSFWSGVETIGKGRVRTQRFGKTSVAGGKSSHTSSSHSLEAVLHKVTSSVLFFLSFLCLSFVLGRMIDLVDVLPYASVVESRTSTPSQSVQPLDASGANMFASGGHEYADAFEDRENGERSALLEYGDPSFDGEAVNFKRDSESILRKSFAPTRTVRTFTLLSLQGESETMLRSDENASTHFESPDSTDTESNLEQQTNEELTGQEADEYRVFLLMLLSSLTILSLFSAFSTFMAFKVNDWAAIPSLNLRSVDWFKRNAALRL